MYISFILPIYNVASYIDKTVSSIILQGLQPEDFEIIAVNDGSTDNSLQVLNTCKIKLLQQGYTNFVIIDQKNSGASAARNAGLRVANGDYIWFVDGDDTLEPNVAKDLLVKAQKSDLDILRFGIWIENKDGSKYKYPNTSLIGEEYLTGHKYITSYGVPPNVWSSLFRREFLLKNHLWLLSGVVHEDLEFPPRAYYLAERVSAADVFAYNYLQREGSVMKSNSVDKQAKKSKDLLTICDSLYTFIINHREMSADTKAWFMAHIAFVFSQSLKNYKKTFPISEYKKRPYYPIAINKLMSSKNKLKYAMINCSLRGYLFLIR